MFPHEHGNADAHGLKFRFTRFENGEQPSPLPQMSETDRRVAPVCSPTMPVWRRRWRRLATRQWNCLLKSGAIQPVRLRVTISPD
jgi:hypothetical protein